MNTMLAHQHRRHKARFVSAAASNIDHTAPSGRRGTDRESPCWMHHPLQDCFGEEQGKAPVELRPKAMAQHFLGNSRNRPFGRVLNSFSLQIKEKVVLPRRIELPTPSLPRTCSTTELRQRQVGGQGAAPGKRRGQCHFGPAKARPGKTRTFPPLSSIFHSSAIVRSCPAGNQRPRKRGHRGSDSTRGEGS